MLSFKIREEIRKVLTLFDGAQYFFECLANINSASPALEHYINQIAVNSDVNIPNALKNHLANVKIYLMRHPVVFFSSIDKLRDGRNIRIWI